TEYQYKWSSPMKIQKEPRDFIEHTQGIFQALKSRIDKENNQLYVAMDTI
ncbi:MAG: hypothetical protein GWN00_40140, partial [Aliifodinibius sp.]|nr:hypothetical protein [Fodinibius sp.]NIV16765.1 hypothetical protein [Fodinibius sp.]NIY30767.1 hypothetical protein [Fodinibius sp.]